MDKGPQKLLAEFRNIVYDDSDYNLRPDERDQIEETLDELRGDFTWDQIIGVMLDMEDERRAEGFYDDTEHADEFANWPDD